MLDSANSLERTAMMVLTLTETLRYANHTITTTPIPSSTAKTTIAGIATTNLEDSHTTTPRPTTTTSLLEYEQCIVKLSVRIRRVEKDMIRILQERYESILQQYTSTAMISMVQQATLPSNTDTSTDGVVADAANASVHASANGMDKINDDDDDGSAASNTAIAVQLLVFGHFVRSLILLGRPKDVEMIFTKIAIQPIIQTYISIRQIDQGGTRGECKNLSHVIQQMMNEISTRYQPLLSYTERMLTIRPINKATNPTTATTAANAMDVDLITTGIWVPLIHTLMTDPTLRMSIFSPGIASIVQTNYQTLVEDCLYHFAEQILVVSSSTCSDRKSVV